MSEKILKNQVDKVKKEIISSLKQYHRLYTANQMETVIPKMHHVTHYPEFIKVMGNPRLYSCIKYERKHQTYKRAEINSNQFKNKPYSIAKWEALTRKIEFRVVESVRISKVSFNPELSENHIYMNYLDTEKNIQIVKECTIKKVRFLPGKCFRTKISDSRWVDFVIIDKIFKQNDEFIIIAHCLRSKSYLKDKCVYEVEFLNKIMPISVDNIYHNELIFIENDMQIIKDFCVDSDFI